MQTNNNLGPPIAVELLELSQHLAAHRIGIVGFSRQLPG